MSRLTKQQVADVCHRYQSGETTGTLARDFGISVRAICGLLERRQIERRKPSESQRHYTCNHAFFATITTELQAYWLGFLAADCYISPSKNSSSAIVLQVAMRDREHLSRFLAAIQSNHPIKEYRYPPVSFARLFLRSSRLTRDIASYGVIPNKTYTLQWPDLPEELLLHFLRGYVDGDGGFHFTFDHRTDLLHDVTFEVTSNQGFIEPCQRFLMRVCQLQQTKLYQRRSSPIYTLRYGGKLQVARIAQLLYSNATIYLPRKQEAAMSIAQQ